MVVGSASSTAGHMSATYVKHANIHTCTYTHVHACFDTHLLLTCNVHMLTLVPSPAGHLQHCAREAMYWSHGKAMWPEITRQPDWWCTLLPNFLTPQCCKHLDVSILLLVFRSCTSMCACACVCLLAWPPQMQWLHPQRFALPKKSQSTLSCCEIFVTN